MTPDAAGPDAAARQDADLAVARAFRAEWGRLVALVIRLTGDWDLAEECAQDAFVQAAATWPRDGVPRRPGAWLVTVARNRARDRLRRRTVETARWEAAAADLPGHEPVAGADAAALADDEEVTMADAVPDDRLLLMFTCCHPALALDARVALTLRTLAGLTTAELARAFLVSPASMAQRLVRAKRKIRHAGIPYRIPPAHLMPERTAGVLAVLYLLFNEGYAASAGPELIRRSLADEAIRLGRVLVDLMPDEPEARGLLALMLLHDARRDARTDDAGDLVTLEHQDRSRWDAARIAEGVTLLEGVPAARRAAPYQLQAAVAACHATAPVAADTDWHRIADLYGTLTGVAPSPVVELNRAVAVAMAEGPDAGLALVEALAASGALPGYHLLPATRADLLRRAGRPAEAALAYAEALALAPGDVERRYLRRRLDEARGSGETRE